MSLQPDLVQRAIEAGLIKARTLKAEGTNEWESRARARKAALIARTLLRYQVEPIDALQWTEDFREDWLLVRVPDIGSRMPSEQTWYMACDLADYELRLRSVPDDL